MKASNDYRVYAETERREMLPFVPEGTRRVRDVSCSVGNFGAILKMLNAAEVWGRAGIEVKRFENFLVFDASPMFSTRSRASLDGRRGKNPKLPSWIGRVSAVSADGVVDRTPSWICSARYRKFLPESLGGRVFYHPRLKPDPYYPEGEFEMTPAPRTVTKSKNRFDTCGG